jgi:hypothetical protein
MTAPLSDENKSVVTASFNISYLKEGKDIVFLPIPDGILRLIGLVAAHWGTFEVVLNKLIEASYVAIGGAPDGWQRLGFAKRKKLFVDIVRNDLKNTFPAAASNYIKIAGDAADLHWQRNIVVHGLYRVTFPPAGSESPTFWAEGTHNGNEVKIPIDVPTLEKLWHGIAHLTGGLMSTVRLHGSVEGWPQTFSDTELLRTHQEAIHPPDPKSANLNK